MSIPPNPPNTLESPAWHEDFLRERSQDIAANTAQFIDWETAKAAIRARAQQNPRP